jgi:hypothetical protein
VIPVPTISPKDAGKGKDAPQELFKDKSSPSSGYPLYKALLLVAAHFWVGPGSCGCFGWSSSSRQEGDGHPKQPPLPDPTLGLRPSLVPPESAQVWMYPCYIRIRFSRFTTVISCSQLPTCLVTDLRRLSLPPGIPELTTGLLLSHTPLVSLFSIRPPQQSTRSETSMWMCLIYAIITARAKSPSSLHGPHISLLMHFLFICFRPFDCIFVFSYRQSR